MPIVVLNSEYQDDFGYVGSTYISNAGDVSTLELTVAESIRVTTVSNPFTFDPI